MTGRKFGSLLRYFMRCKFALAVIIITLTITACTPAPPTPTLTPLPTKTATTLPTLTPTLVTMPTHKPLPTATPIAQVTACPVAGLIVRACIDDSDDGECSDNEPPVFATIWLAYDVGVQEPHYIEIPMGAGGLAALSLTPGLYRPMIYSIESTERVIADYRQVLAFVVNQGNTYILHVPFQRVYPVVTPTPTTPTPTKTPAPYACPSFATMCMPACDGNLTVDERGQCQPPLVCCTVKPTRTVTP